MSILKTRTVKGGENTEVYFKKPSLYDIPNLMDKMGWPVASALMRHWFERPLAEITDSLRIKYMKGKAIEIPDDMYNDNIVKMSWAIRYKQVQDAIDELINEKLGNKASSNSLFGRLLERNIIKSSSSKEIYAGYDDNILDIDYTTQVNMTQFGGFFDTVDELRGAIGSGNLELCIRGCYDLSGEKKKFLVDKIGFYIKDSYDFSGGSELLGIWSWDGVLPFSDMPKYMASHAAGFWGKLYREYKGFVPVFNKDFREWQKTHHEGGDFIVFSDVYWIDPPSKFKVMYEIK
ncbi:DUF6402 family protein [Xenorhabdus sp. PR6a]|uniref:DUF6402 family protein n=1 Tax=Xenorhabdus sp. PR6a TaxID=3025877 RepID=UPI002358F7D3|nr:DUF6402 family protein [Xenorhabdus sp. PR6a]MDC9580580.1 DUF6402 family protein [Xenorhabdus sp. PR6a]